MTDPNTRGPLALVIFDCDGVLVDSEPISLGLLSAMLHEIDMGLADLAMERLFMGRTMKEGLEALARHFGRPAPATFPERFHARLFDVFRKELRPVPGIVDALDRIPTPTCVASSSDPARMRLSLEVAGLMPRFEGRLFSAVEVARGKPFPDIFLHAAGKMGVAPEECVVVEDSVSGVEAAVAAGMRVLGYARRSNARALAASGAQAFDDMRDLPGLLQTSAK